MKRHQIYFLRRRDGLIKVGTTTDLQQRIEALTKAHGPLEVVRVINGDVHRERQLHQQFRSYRQFGEWFSDPAGVVTAAACLIDEGTAIEVASSDAKAAWLAGEAEFMDAFRAKVDALIKVRMDYTMEKRATAIERLSAEYGFPKWFLSHSRANATTVSAYGFERVKRAYRAEMLAALEHFNAEIQRVSADNLDAEILAIGARVAELEQLHSERKAKREAVK